MSKVRKDDNGLYIQINGTKHRPGNIRGFAHAYDMSDGNLKKGDSVKAKSISQAPVCHIMLENNTLCWASPESMWGKDTRI